MLAIIAIALFAVWCLAGIRYPPAAAALIILQFAVEQALQSFVPALRFGVGGVFTNAIIAAVAAISALRICLQDRSAFQGWANFPMLAVLVLYGWSIFTIFWSPSVTDAIGNLTWGLPYLVVVQMLCPFLIRSLRDLQHLWLWVLCAGTIFILLIIASPEFDLRNGRLTFVLAGTTESSPLAIGELGGVILLAGALLRRSELGPAAKICVSVLRFVALISGTLVTIQSGARGQFFFAAFLALSLFPLSAPVRSIASFFTTIVGVVFSAITIYLLFSTFLAQGGVAAKRFDINELLYGASSATGRWENVILLFNAWIRAPQYWVVGLGYNAFTAFTPTVEPYSHVLFADAVFELGLVGLAMLGSSLSLGFLSMSRLFKDAQEEPGNRSAVSVLVAMTLFQVLVVNKQGALWAVPTLFAFLAIAARIHDRSLAGLDRRADSDEASDGPPLDEVQRTAGIAKL